MEEAPIVKVGRRWTTDDIYLRSASSVAAAAASERERDCEISFEIKIPSRSRSWIEIFLEIVEEL